ncbi:MAG: hypothetical protein WDN44_05890 [Sphingomonas sp.]
MIPSYARSTGLTELVGTMIGPVAGSRIPGQVRAHPGLCGRPDRSGGALLWRGQCRDPRLVLGYSPAEVAALAEEGVL